MKKSPVLLVIGAGAIGGIIAGVLKKKGFDITLITRDSNLARDISKKGIELRGHCGNFSITLPSVSKVTEIKKRPDIIFIATRADDMPAATKAVLPLLLEDTMVVSLQNGIVEEKLASIIGKKRTVGCVVGWGATRHSDRLTEMTSSGEFVVGYLDRKPDNNLIKLTQILSNIHPSVPSDNIIEHLYSKLIINSCITTVGAICGLPLGKMLKRRSYRILFLNIIKEAINVANKMQWTIPSYAGKLNYYELLNWSKFRQHFFLLLFGFKYRKLKSSSLQSLERGRKTEVRYFNGFISDKGKKHHIETPVNDRMLKLVEEIEEGKRDISVRNFHE